MPRTFLKWFSTSPYFWIDPISNYYYCYFLNDVRIDPFGELCNIEKKQTGRERERKKGFSLDKTTWKIRMWYLKKITSHLCIILFKSSSSLLSSFFSFCFLNCDSLHFSVSGPIHNSAFIPEVQICTAPVASPVHMTFITFVCYHTLLDVFMCSMSVVLVPRCVSPNHKHCSNHMLLFSHQNGHTPFIRSQQCFTNTHMNTLSLTKDPTGVEVNT